MPLTGFRIDALVVDPRGAHRHRARRGQHLPLGVVAVAHHQAATVLVDLVGEWVDVGGDLGLNAAASICRAPSRTISSSSDRVPPHRRWWSRVVNYREHGRTFPTSVGAPA